MTDKLHLILGAALAIVMCHLNFALAEIPLGCDVAGNHMHGLGIGSAVFKSDGSDWPAQIGDLITVKFQAQAQPLTCALEGGQVAIAFSPENIVSVLGFPETPEVPLFYFNNPNGPTGFLAQTPPTAVRCEDVCEMSPGSGPIVSIRAAWGGDLFGLPLQTSLYHAPSPQAGPDIDWAVAVPVDLESYKQQCRPASRQARTRTLAKSNR